MAKYDWTTLRRKFITGNYSTLKEFSEAEQLPYTLLRQNAKGWNEQKRTTVEHKSNKIIEKTVQQQIDSESGVNNRHLQLYGKALDSIEQVFMELINDNGEISIYKLEKLVQTLQRTQSGQRLALGMDKDGGNAEIERNLETTFTAMRRAFKDD